MFIDVIKKKLLDNKYLEIFVYIYNLTENIKTNTHI